MTIVSPMGQLRPVFADKNGKRLSGGKVFTYEPGTLTPKATYADALNLISNTNPIDLDKYGEADIFLNGDYRIRVVDRHGVLIDDYDNLMAWATKRYLDSALSGFASGANNFYPTLADANADIANIAVNQVVNIGELENGGLWYKEGTESTTLTKTPYDAFELSKQYSNQKQVVQEQYINDLFAAQTQNVENLINQQGVSLQQLDNYYNYLMQRIAQIAVDKGWEASFVVDESGGNQQQINDRIGNKWYEKPLGYSINDRVMLDNGDIVKSTAPNNTANPNSDMTGWVKINDASQIFDASGKSQQEMNIAYTGKRWFAPLYGVKADGETPDDVALNNIISNMNDGDILEVLPRKHKLNNPIIIDKPILVTSNSNRHQTMGALFDCDAGGVVFKSPWICWEGISLVGKYTGTLLNPSAKIFGSIGMKHECSSSGTSSGVVIRDCFVTYFDTNVVEAQEAGEAWAGAYREYYNVFLRYGRVNLAMIDGATLSNWHGGAIQFGVERGVHLDCPNMQYNNLVLHGTALEKNGYIAGLFPATEQKTYGLYAGKNSRILVHGGYSEDQSCFAENGGRIEFYGSYQHPNSKLFAKKDGVISNVGGFEAISNRLSINENYATFLSTSATDTTIAQISSINKSCRVTSTANAAIVIQSRGVSLSQLKTDNLGAVKLSVKYNISSGFTANPNIIITPSVRLTSGANSDAVIQNLTYPNFELKDESNKDATFEFYLKPRAGASYLPLGADLSGLYVIFTVQNVDGTPCNFSTDNLNLTFKNIEVEVYSSAAFDFISELPKSGTTANRPTKLGSYERGFAYYDTTESRQYLWSGAAWVKQKSAGDDLFASYSTAQLSDITNSVNTSYKLTSNFVFNNTNSKMYYRTGTSAYSVWRCTDGVAPDITPT